MKTILCSGFLVTFPALLLLATGCRNNKDILAEDIDYLYVDYDMYTQNNLGTTFPGTIGVQMNSGESIQLKNNRGFTSSDNLDANIKDAVLAVYGPLPSYKSSKIAVDLYFTDKNDVTLQFTDSVTINFRGNTQAWYNGVPGSTGQTGTRGTTPLLWRNGNDGGQGGMGQDGSNGDNMEVYCWKMSDTLFFYVFNQTRNYGERFMVIGDTPIFYVEAYGGSGGTGGKGGDGGDGKNGETAGNNPKGPGDGGRGGFGGQGGRGGNGGNVSVNIHPSAGDAEKQLRINVDGGYGGSGGSGGDAGKAGTAATGQLAAKPGKAGSSGPAGATGVQGNVYILKRDFDYMTYMK